MPASKFALGLKKPLLLAGIGSLAFAALTPQAALAAPAITFKGSFNRANGANPWAALTPAGNGRTFYGTTTEGGVYGSGAIFEFDPSGGGSITLKGSFNRGTGAYPHAALTPAGNGTTFYGTTALGGVNDSGAIFEFDPSDSGSITLKGSFNGANGANPYAALTPAGNGATFYGTTRYGGANGYGAIFEFDPSGSGSITLKGSFDTDCSSPYAALTPAGNGTKFYGTTSGCGVYGSGAIFEFDPSGSGSITLKGSFNRANGANPYAALTPAGNGATFYGTTALGGVNDSGAIFEFDPSDSGSITLKGSFNGANGANPYAALTPAGNGATFYGTTVNGGFNNTYGDGVIFEFDPSGSGAIAIKGTFDPSNGADPYAALIPAGNGRTFYGTVYDGAYARSGAIFEFDPGADSVGTPSPLPLLGATAAFGWSRKLRRRIQAVRPMFPIGR